MDPTEFLQTAGDLVTGSRESDWRSAVSRAYYACFHVASNVIISNVPKNVLKNSGYRNTQLDHDFVVRCLKNSQVPDVTSLGDSLGDLKATRKKADYRLNIEFDAKKAEDARDDAQDLLDEIEVTTETKIGSAVAALLRISPSAHPIPVK